MGKRNPIRCVETGKIYVSSMDAERRTGIDHRKILLCCKGSVDKAGGYQWEYFYFSREPNTIYTLSLSYGKDSLACLGVIKKLGLPLDRIVHAEVWATDTIPADLPPMVEFKKKADKIIKERYGIEVEHVWATKKNGGYSHTRTCCTSQCQAENLSVRIEGSPLQETLGVGNLKSTKLTYEDIFYRQLKHRVGGGGLLRVPDAERSMVQQPSQSQCPQQYTDSLTGVGWAVGAENSKPKLSTIYGFAGNYNMGRAQWCTGLKRDTIKREFSLSPRTKGGIKIVQYLGIAADEPERIERHQKKKNIMLPLVMAGWDEEYCRKWCEERDLLSPIYTTATRGGCWFCHNQGVGQLRLLRKHYPDLWALLMKWDLDSPTTFKADGHTVHDYDKRFELEDKGVIHKDDLFYWKYIDNPPDWRQLRIDEV